MEYKTNRNGVEERIYMRYEYLAKVYAAKVFNSERIGYDYDDLLQEFKIKILTSIRSYGLRYAKYEDGEASKPVPIQYYLESSCSNKAIDLMKVISREPYSMSIESQDFDYGIECDTVIDKEKNVYILNGVDVLEGLSGNDRLSFIMYIKGFSTNRINKVIKNGETVISKQKEKLLKKYGKELYRQSYTRYSYTTNED